MQISPRSWPAHGPGVRPAEEITIFDSTGTALQDLEAAIAVEARARAAGAGQVVDLGA